MARLEVGANGLMENVSGVFGALEGKGGDEVETERTEGIAGQPLEPETNTQWAQQRGESEFIPKEKKCDGDAMKQELIELEGKLRKLRRDLLKLDKAVHYGFSFQHTQSEEPSKFGVWIGCGAMIYFGIVKLLAEHVEYERILVEIFVLTTLAFVFLRSPFLEQTNDIPTHAMKPRPTDEECFAPLQNPVQEEEVKHSRASKANLDEKNEEKCEEREPVYVDGWVIKNEKEVKAVLELRSRLADIAEFCTHPSLDMTNSTLVRFCRARRLDVNKAEILYRIAYQWREENKPLDMLDKVPVAISEYLPGGFLGTDKEGSPVFYDRLGRFDIPGLAKRVNTADGWIANAVFRQETLTKIFQERSTPERKQYQVLVVTDLKGLSKRHMYLKGLPIFKQVAYMEDHVYPERLKTCIIVNAPRIFNTIWSVVKWCLDPVTRGKVEIYSSASVDHLLKHIDKEQLPQYLGGDLAIDGDPECSAVIVPGGRLPEDYYPDNN